MTSVFLQYTKYDKYVCHFTNCDVILLTLGSIQPLTEMGKAKGAPITGHEGPEG